MSETEVPAAAPVAGTSAAPTPAAVATSLAEYGANGPNPLRDPSDRRLPRVPQPCALVIFGVTGDLARKKLLPAVYDLANRGLLPPGFVILGFGRRSWSHGDFEGIAREAAQAHARTQWR